MINSSFPIPKEPGAWQSIALAVAVHVCLLAFLWIGIRWRNDVPETIEAEIWSAQVHESAPVQFVQSVPTPAIPEPQTDSREVGGQQPEIAIEQEKIENRNRQAGDWEKKSRSNIKLTQDKIRLQNAGIPEQRDNDVNNAAIESEASGRTGAASKSQGNQGNFAWLGRVKAKIEENILYTIVPSDREANSPVKFSVTLRRDGSIEDIQIEITKKYGNPAFAEAVRSAIEKSQPYPADKSGKVPRGFNSTIQPTDLDNRLKQDEPQEDE